MGTDGHIPLNGTFCPILGISPHRYGRNHMYPPDAVPESVRKAENSGWHAKVSM